MKNTKRALLLSALALMMCVAMLIGSTFAWFTDSASTAVNTIQSGTLKVELEMLVDEDNDKWESVEGETLNWVTADGRTDNILWEPGCTYKLPKLRVRNAGNLALKYEVVITGLKGDAKLLEVIKFTGLPENATLLAGKSNEFEIVGTMDKDAGNDYQDLKIENIAITVYATQLNSESDSYGPDYDKDAIYYDALVKTADELYAAVSAAKGDYVIAVDGNITLTKALSKGGLKSIKFVAFSDDATIDQATYNMHFNSAKVTFEGLTLTHGEKAYGDGGQTSTAFAVWEAKEVNYVDCTFNRSVGTIHAPLHNFIRCTFNGVENPDNSKSEYPLYICDGENYNVIDCTFNCTNRGAILFYNDGGNGVDTLNISGTKFYGDIIADKTAVEIHNNSTTQVYNVNIKDVIVGDGIINGLWRIKPDNKGEVNVKVDGVKEVATASNAEELESALKALKSGDTLVLDADITVAKNWDNRFTGAKFLNPIVIDGNGNTIKFTGNVYDGGNYHAAFRFEAPATVKNLTFDMSEVAGTGTWLRAISSKSDLTVDNCTFIGSDNYTKDNLVVIGDISGNAQIDVNVSITNCHFENARRGISDNENAQEVKNIVISGNTFKNAPVYISAYNEMTVTDNIFDAALLNITSYTAAATAKVTVKGNTLDANQINIIGGASKIFTAANVDAQADIVVNAQ